MLTGLWATASQYTPFAYWNNSIDALMADANPGLTAFAPSAASGVPGYAVHQSTVCMYVCMYVCMSVSVSVSVSECV